MADASKPRARPLPAPPGGASGGKAGTGAAAAAAAAAPTTSSSASNSNLSRSRKLIGAPFDQQRKAVIKLQAWYRCVVVRRASLPLAAQMRRRFLIAQEIATSEQSYLANIRVLTGVRHRSRPRHRGTNHRDLLSCSCSHVSASLYAQLFLNPLRSALDYTDGAPPITKDEMKSIFSNIEGIQALNFSVLERLQSRLHNWHPYQPIGDIFLKMVRSRPTLSMANQSESVTLVACRRRSSRSTRSTARTTTPPSRPSPRSPRGRCSSSSSRYDMSSPMCECASADRRV